MNKNTINKVWEWSEVWGVSVRTIARWKELKKPFEHTLVMAEYLLCDRKTPPALQAEARSKLRWPADVRAMLEKGLLRRHEMDAELLQYVIFAQQWEKAGSGHVAFPSFTAQRPKIEARP